MTRWPFGFFTCVFFTFSLSWTLFFHYRSNTKGPKNRLSALKCEPSQQWYHGATDLHETWGIFVDKVSIVHYAKPGQFGYFFAIARDWRRFFKHTIWSLPKHTSATMYTSTIGNAIIFKTDIFVAHRAGRRGGCRGSHTALDVALVWTGTRFLRLSSRPSSHSCSRWRVLLFRS